MTATSQSLRLPLKQQRSFFVQKLEHVIFFKNEPEKISHPLPSRLKCMSYRCLPWPVLFICPNFFELEPFLVSFFFFFFRFVLPAWFDWFRRKRRQRRRVGRQVNNHFMRPEHNDGWPFKGLQFFMVLWLLEMKDFLFLLWDNLINWWMERVLRKLLLETSSVL